MLAVAAIGLPGCGGSTDALVVSGGHSDFAAMSRIREQYGTGDAVARVPVLVGDQQYTFAIWVSVDDRRIMAQTAAMGAVATAGFLRGLTAGAVTGDLDFEPYRGAAATYLDNTRGPGCILKNSRKLTHIGWEWDFECSPPSPAPRRR